MLATIEAGGTKFVCTVSDIHLNIIAQHSIPTTTPIETLQHVFAFFKPFTLSAMTIGCFGPIDINPKSLTYGYIKSTPKMAWKHFNILNIFKEEYPIPIMWHTDVGIAAYGEYHFGAGIGKPNCLYITIGTGIGGGMVINGHLLDSTYHAELGHILVRQLPEDNFHGCCPYHLDCLEGLASGPAIEERWGQQANQLSPTHPAWHYEAYYLAQAVLNYTLTLTPDIIILGGGVMNQHHIIDKVRQQFAKLLNSYLELPPLDEFIVLPKLMGQSATMGGLMLAKENSGLNTY